MQTLDQLFIYTRRLLAESATSPAFWDERDILIALADGYDEISDECEWFETSDTLHKTDDSSYYDLRQVLSYPILTPKQCFNNVTRWWMTMVDVRDLDLDWYPRWETIPGEPKRLFMRGLWWLGTFPKKPTESSEHGRMSISEFLPPPDGNIDGPDRMRLLTVGFAIGNTNPTGLVLYYTAMPAPLFPFDPHDAAAVIPDLSGILLPDFPREFYVALAEYACYDLLAQDGETKNALIHWQEYQKLQEAFRLYVNQRTSMDRVGVLNEELWGDKP